VTRRSHTEEAHLCRAQAKHFAGKPEQALLLTLASAFDELTLAEAGGHRVGQRERHRLSRS
jgi:hypothetical protein